MRYRKIPMILSVSREWFTMTAPAEPTVIEVTPPEPQPDENVSALKNEIAEIKGTMTALENSTANLSNEVRQWMTDQLTPLKQTVANLEASALTGLENLTEQINQIKADLADLSTQNSPVIQEQEVTEVEAVQPPVQPESGEGTPTPAPVQTASQGEQGNQVPNNPKRKKRVV